MSERKRYAGERVSVTFDGARCLHAAECVRSLPAVFDTSRRPWVLPDAAPADRVEAVVRRCPTGALRYEPTGSPPAAAEPPDAPTTVVAHEGGPLWLRGDLSIETADGVVRETRAALCRCGRTANAPYCDASGPCTAWR